MKTDVIKCEECGASKNVSYWLYSFNPAEYDGHDFNGYYCPSCGRKPYVVAIGLVVLAIGIMLSGIYL